MTDTIYFHHQDCPATCTVLAAGPRPVGPGCPLEAIAPLSSQVQEGDLGLCIPGDANSRSNFLQVALTLNSMAVGPWPQCS